MLGSARYADEYVRSLFGKCKTVIWSEEVWPWANQVDLIICSTGIKNSLNCYPIQCLIIDTSLESNECYNIENRVIYNRNFLNKVIQKNVF